MIQRILCGLGIHRGIWDLGTPWTHTATSRGGDIETTHYLRQKRVCQDCHTIQFQKIEVRREYRPSWDRDRNV